MSILVQMTEEEFLAYAAQENASYAREKVRSGEWREAEALALAEKSFRELLPDGLAPQDNHLFTLHDVDARLNVGVLWFAVQVRGGKRIAYVYDVSIKPEYRRQGYAARAFLALEDEVRTRGLSGIALHVFAHNTAAHALYVKLGYLPTDINMFKAIGAAGNHG